MKLPQFSSRCLLSTLQISLYGQHKTTSAPRYALIQFERSPYGLFVPIIALDVHPRTFTGLTKSGRTIRVFRVYFRHTENNTKIKRTSNLHYFLFIAVFECTQGTYILSAYIITIPV